MGSPSNLPVAELEALLKRAVSDGVAPGAQAIVFDREGTLFEGHEGLHTQPSPAEAQHGRPFHRNTVSWMASCSKLVLSLMVLQVLERKLSKTGTTLGDLDSHEALVAVLAEFKLGGGDMLTSILEGYGPLGADGKMILKLRPTKRGVTLRHLLTHTAGLTYPWGSEMAAAFHDPKLEGAKPHARMHFTTAKIEDLQMPAVSEPGERWEYGPASDWLGQFIVRATGENLPTLLRNLILWPLSLDEAQIGCRSDALLSSGTVEMAAMSMRNPSGTSPRFVNVPFTMAAPATEDPLPGMTFVGSAFLYSTLPAFAAILRACLAHDAALLREETWQLAERDDTSARGVKHPVPIIPGVLPQFAHEMERLYETVGDEGEEVGVGYGANLLQTHVATAQTKSGRSKGSYAWLGLANTYYFVDHSRGLGGVISTQLLPCGDPALLALKDRFEALICGQSAEE